ncbi:guanylate kinase [Calditrichota bacterium]
MRKLKSSLIVLSAPSGAGKTSLARALVANNPQCAISVSATSRSKRFNEQNGIDYIFLTKEEFEKKISDGDFLEYEQVHGEYYGTLKKTVEDMIANNKSVVFDIDVNGALCIKRGHPEAILIFIKAPSEEELIRRLRGRKSETKEMIEKRLERLPYEYEQSKKFDYIIVNEHFNQTVNEIEKIVIE